MASKQTATWNRDDRDLLVELRTNMNNLSSDIGAARAEVKDLSVGMTARLLNLEANSVNKVQVIDLESRLRILENTGNQWLGKQQLISGGIGLAVSLLAIWVQTGKI